MTVSEILNLAIGEFGTRYNLQVSDALRLLNQIQAMAFDADLQAFLVSDQFVTVSTGVKGPYNFPTTPPVRRFVGVTQFTQSQLMGTGQRFIDLDFGLVLNAGPVDSRNMFEDIIIDTFGRAFTFNISPSDVTDAYRMVYYRRAPSIRSATDDTNLLIPVEYHHSLCVQGIGALADYSIYGTKNGRLRIQEDMIKPFWDSLNTTTDGNRGQLISDGTVGL
jgi:hypothetical protein